MSIWQHYNGVQHIKPLTLRGYRIVEHQHTTSTRQLVDSDAEHDVLEAMIESAKPPRMAGTERLDYLLATPFRYPPHPHGSRFHTVAEPSIFYGAMELQTAMAERAFYTFTFFSDTEAKLSPSNVGCTSFMFDAATDHGIALEAPPFDNLVQRISNPNSYADSQPLGAAMRAAGVQCFTYQSARCPNKGTNIAIIDPASFTHRKHKKTQHWKCYRDYYSVSFRQPNNEERYEFSLSQYAKNPAE